MLQDFAKSAERHKQRLSKDKPSGGISRLRIAVTVILTLGFAFGLYSLTQVRPELAPEELLPQAAALAEADAAGTEPVAEPVKPARGEEFYDFYTLLPESEVIAPKVEEYFSPPKNPAAKDQAYLLQAGSFRNKSDADRLRAKLILKGLDVKLSSVSGRNGGIWHRVVVGPFRSRSKLNLAQDILADANTESMLMMVK